MYKLRELAYECDALEPVIDARTMVLGPGIHHAGYVTDADHALAALAEARARAQYEPITTSERDLAFHASGHVLHSRFWQSMHPNLTASDPGLAALIDRDIGSSGAPRYRLSAAASPVKASGWVALSWEPTQHQLGVDHLL